MTANQIAPETIFNGLLDRLVVALGTGTNFSALELKRFEREIGALARVDAAGAFELRAHVASLEGKFEDADEYFEKALTQTTEIVSTVVRYLVVLAAVARGERLMETFLRFKSILRNDPAAIRTVSQVLAGSGWVRTSHEFAAEADRLGARAEAIGVDAMSIDSDAEREIAAAVCFAHNFLRSRGSAPEAVETIVIPTEDGRPSLFYQFSLDKTPEDVAELEWDLFGALAGKNFAVQRDGKIVFALAAGAADAD